MTSLKTKIWKALLLGMFSFLLCQYAYGQTMNLPVVFDKTFSGGSTGTVYVEMADEWFVDAQPRYDHQLARLSLGLAVSAFRNVEENDSHSDGTLLLEENKTLGSSGIAKSI